MTKIRYLSQRKEVFFKELKSGELFRTNAGLTLWVKAHDINGRHFAVLLENGFITTFNQETVVESIDMSIKPEPLVEELPE